MSKLKLITLLWSLLITSNGFLEGETERYRSRDHMMQSIGYPRPGDIPTLNRKIFKAQRVTIREHPYVVSVRRLCSHYVTGALATKNIVLTVAHPLYKVPVRELNVVLGENYSDRGPTLRTVVLVILHDRFDPYTLKNDIAMLRVYEQISYKMNIKSILLTPQNSNLAGKKAFVTGWGRCDNMGTELCLDRTSKYYPDEKMDPMLRTVSFNITFPNFYCEGYRRHDVTLHPGMLCTGVAREEDQVASCLGVPGAPLVVDARLAGLLSWGFGCGYSYDMPLVYTEISHFLPWISHNNIVLYPLKLDNFTELFEATKASVLSQWLMETRDIKPNSTIRTDKTMSPLIIDHTLVKLKGILYDVRDFINDGEYSDEKEKMYESMRSELKKLVSSTARTTRRRTTGRPFLGNLSRQEAGL